MLDLGRLLLLLPHERLRASKCETKYEGYGKREEVQSDVGIEEGE